MKPDPRFLKQPKTFWAHVRTISEQFGYTKRGEGVIKTPQLADIAEILETIGLSDRNILNQDNSPSDFCRLLVDYYEYRANILNTYVEPRLMNVERTQKVFEALKHSLSPRCPIPLNKQKGDKKAVNYLTAIVNMLIEANAESLPCTYDPRTLTSITRDGMLLRTLARRLDGAFPSAINPIAVWEIKEYYYTTTFGSRVADGVYESLLDGLELEELREHEGIDVKHYLMVDSHYTWWECGRSYLCRIIDMLHMGYIDEVLFGYEVVERLPQIVKEWVTLAKSRIS